MRVRDLTTPALLVDLSAFNANVATMGARWPGVSLRPHVKAFKSTALARRLADAGHSSFCCATVREAEGMVAAGFGEDLLLANELADRRATRRLGALAATGNARITLAVDSVETIEAAVAGGVRDVLIDVNVGMPRCGCGHADAGRLADLARTRGLEVRGVMGYEGHLVMLEDRDLRAGGTEASMAKLLQAHDAVGGDVLSGGGTGTWDLNTWVTELQAGSFTLMDTTYAKVGLPFQQALAVLGQVISTRTVGAIWAVADVGLKALGMDHGNPSIEGMAVWVCSDEQITFALEDASELPSVGDHVLVWPAHIDPTVSQHERMHIVPSLTGQRDQVLDNEIIDVWPIDLRNW